MVKNVRAEYFSVMALHYRSQPHRETVMELAGMPNPITVASIIHTMRRQNPDLNVDLLSKDVALERARMQLLEEKIAVPRRLRPILAFLRRLADSFL